jgi:lipoprotein-anchoring transpeptidase ErfK/SrfK
MTHPYLLALLIALLAPSCKVLEKKPDPMSRYQTYDLPAKRPQNPDNVRIKVSLSKQRAYVIEGSEILLAMPVSVGAPATPTPQGDFRISDKSTSRRDPINGFAHQGDQTKKTTTANIPRGWSFKGAPLPYWCGFKPSYGFHTSWIRHHPCTNGCIRMHQNLAPKFYQLVKVGTPLNIAYSQPEDATTATLPLPPDAGPLPDYPGSLYVGDGYFKRHIAPTLR